MNKKEYFYLRDLKIAHSRSSMPIGTDSLLLGSWIKINNLVKILDVGTGCGIIALILGRKFKNKIRIDAIDIDKESIEEASENIIRNKLENTIQAHLSSFQQWQSEKYDLIISNPPYFQNSLLNENENRKNARHQVTLTINELIDRAGELLNPKGSLQLIFPVSRSMYLIEYALESGFSLIRKTSFIHKKGGKPTRHLLEFCLDINNSDTEENEIYYYDTEGQMHSSAKELLGNIKSIILD